MGKIWIEITLISARGLRRSSLLWNRQWFAVGWIDPDSKYCTKVDDSGNENPVWKTKFAILFDDSESEKKLEDLELKVEVHSIDPIFLIERIHGSATVVLKEFLAKVQNSNFSLRPKNEEVRSYQLRNKDSTKLRGFIDISIRVSQDKEEQSSNPGKEEGGGTLVLNNGTGNDTHLTADSRLGSIHSQQYPLASLHQSSEKNVPYSHPMPFPANYTDPYEDDGPSYEPSRTPSPPPPPSNVGFVPTFIPRNDPLPSSSSSSSSSSSRAASSDEKVPPGLAMGALAAGALIFGDDFMSGFDVLPGLPDDDSLTLQNDPPF